MLSDCPCLCRPFAEQTRIVAEVDRHLSIIREVEAEVDTNLKRAQALRQATLAKAFPLNIEDRNMAEPCPICKHDLVKSEDRGERLFFECPRCGCYSMSRTAFVYTLGWHV